ncbi:hypothetical protein KY285_026758 [Solanum tuberosum]|nr:hypothetical protein KY285_026758 [Solanum tuberosum]
MTLDELVGNLKTYEMNVDKEVRETKKKNLGLKAIESDKSDIDDEDLALISRNFKKLFKRGMNFGIKAPPTKEKTIEKPQSGGYFKCGKTDHHIKDFHMWEVEWRKEKAEKEKMELLSKRKNKENEQAMYAAWGTGSDIYEKDVDDIALMAIKESEPKPNSDI